MNPDELVVEKFEASIEVTPAMEQAAKLAVERQARIEERVEMGDSLRAAQREVDRQIERDQEGREFEQPYLDPAEAVKALDQRVLVVCDSCRHVVEQIDNQEPKGMFVTPCPKCGGETGTYSPRCGVEGCDGYAFALMPGIGSRCKPHWRKMKREAERGSSRPGAAGRKHGRNKKSRKRR